MDAGPTPGHWFGNQNSDNCNHTSKVNLKFWPMCTRFLMYFGYYSTNAGHGGLI
jgi:hypothetical protein